MKYMEELIIKYDKKIMELEREIERLTKEVTYERKMRNFMMDKSFEYVERIDKAIEFLNEECSFDEEIGYCDDLWCGDASKLVNILKGVDKDGKN